jgi:hypothetical protein
MDEHQTEHIMKIENNVLIKVDDSDIQDGKFVFPKGITTIESSAFNFCCNLISLDIPKSVDFIGTNAFSSCLNLCSVVIPEGVTSILWCTFLCCRNLTAITIPKSVTLIDSEAFLECTALAVIHINAESEENYARIYGLLPLKLQNIVQTCHQSFNEKAIMLLAGSKQEPGFFRTNVIPSEISHHILYKLAHQYGIPSFMLNEISQKFGMEVECPHPVKPAFSIGG